MPAQTTERVEPVNIPSMPMPELPDVWQDPGVAVIEQRPPEVDTVPLAEAEGLTISVTLPMVSPDELPEGLRGRKHFGFNLRSQPAVNALWRLAQALDRQQARLGSGVRVVDMTGALRWLLEQVGAAAEES